MSGDEQMMPGWLVRELLVGDRIVCPKDAQRIETVKRVQLNGQWLFLRTSSHDHVLHRDSRVTRMVAL